MYIDPQASNSKSIVSEPFRSSKVKQVSSPCQMSAPNVEQAPLVNFLGSSNLSTHYTPVYLCPSSTFSMQSHLLADGIEPSIPYSPFSPLDFCHRIACIALMPCASIILYTQTNNGEREREREKERQDKTQAYVL